MADSTNKHLRWLFPLCFIAGILIGGALSLSQGDPEPAMRRSLPPAIVHDLNYHPPFPDHLRTAFSECTQLLKQTDPESIDKAELIALVQELAVAKQDLLSPILNQLLQVLGSDREFRTAAYDWAMEHPAAAMQFCLDFEGAPHQIVGSIKSAALGMPGGARLFIEHVNSATNLNGVSPSDVKVAL